MYLGTSRNHHTLATVIMLLLLLCIALSEVSAFHMMHKSAIPIARSSLEMGFFSCHDKIVVTGLGIISPAGSTAPVFFDNICQGNSAITSVTRFDAAAFKCQIAAQIKEFDPKSHYKSKKKIKQNDLSCHYAVAASHQALEDAGLDLKGGDTVDATRAGVIIGSAFGGMDSFEKAANDLKDYGPSAIGPYTIPMMLGNTPAGIVAMETGAKGPNFGVQTACATATHAFGEAIRLMKNGTLVLFFSSLLSLQAFLN